MKRNSFGSLAARATLAAFTLPAFLLLNFPAALAQGINVAGYTVPNPSAPIGIRTGPDGALWFTDDFNGLPAGNTGSIGRITTSGVITNRYAIAAGSAFFPQAIASGSDGALWYTVSGGVTRVTTAGAFTLEASPSATPYDITSGSDGALWFTDDTGANIWQLTTAGVLTQFPLPMGHFSADSITSGPDGALWFTSDGHASIGRITTAGVFTFTTVPNANPEEEGLYFGTITTGSDGALWFTEPSNNAVGRITTAMVVTTPFAIPSASIVTGITSGSDGALWMIEPYNNSLARASTAGAIQEYTLGAAEGSVLNAITSGPDGALWYTQSDYEASQGIIGQVAIIPQLTITAACPATEAVINTPYSFSITTTGGLAPLTWTLNNPLSLPLPPGVTLNPATGVITGTPTALGTYPFSVTVTDSSSPTPQAATYVCSITVATQLTITSACPAPAGFPATPYAYTVSAAGGVEFEANFPVSPYQWSILPAASSLPPGLALANSGAPLVLESIQGTPSMSGIFSFTLQAQDAGGQTATQPCSITIVSPLTITGPATLPNGVLNAAYPSTAIQAQGGTIPYHWTATGLPAGLNLSAAGVLTGTPTTPGAYTPTVTVMDSSFYSLNITETLVPTAQSSPLGITTGPDGALWFTENGYMGTGGKIGRITTAGVVTEFPIATPGSAPGGITAGPDGALWFTEEGGNNIGRMKTGGVLTEYPIPTQGSEPAYIALGPDGALWFTEANANQIGRITTAGVITEYPIPSEGLLEPSDIIAGPDGALWFTELDGNQIGRITTAGVITQYTVPTPSARPYGIVAGPDGALWFTEGDGNKIGRVTTAGVFTEYVLPTQESQPQGITAGPDGALWFSELGGSAIGRITTAGVITGYSIPTAASEPLGITQGPDGALWFTELNGNKIGRVAIGAQMAQKTYSLTISQLVLTITGACPALSGVQGSSYYVYPITVSGGNGVYQLSLTGPSWLSLGTPVTQGGILYTSLNGTPQFAGDYSFSLQATDSAGSVPATVSCTITIVAPLGITSGCPAPATLGTVYSQPLTATGGTGGYVWSIPAGTLPSGLILNVNAISGTPTGPPGVSTFVIQVSSGGLVAQADCTMTVLGLKFTAACPGNGTVGVAYGPFALTASGGSSQSSYAFSAQGSLPPGVSISGSTFGGTPTSAGTYNFTFVVTSGGQSANGPPCSVVITAPPLTVKGSCSAASVSAGSPFSMSVAVSGGQSPYSFALTGASWLTLNPPSGANDTATGTPTAANAGTTYTAVITASDSASSTPVAFSCTVTVTSLPKLTFSIACPANPIAPGAPVNVPLNAGGGLAPYSWAISGNSGLALSSASGVTSSVVGNAPGSSGSYSFLVTLSDSAGSPSTPQGCTLTIPYSQLQIQGTCPASSLNVPVSLSVALTATGGQAPYSWSLSAPSWLGLSATTGSATAVTSIGTPATSGPFSFTVTLNDSTGSGSAQFPCSSTINPPTIPGLSITGVAPNGNPMQALPVGVQLAAPAPLGLTGVLQLTFTPNAFGIGNNPQVAFNGGGTQVTFTIPAGQTGPATPLPAIQQGTVAGTIQVQLIDLKQGSTEVLPTPAPVQNLIIPQQAPVVLSACFANQTANSFDVLISGYSNPRQMTSVSLSFQAAQGATLNGNSSFTENVTSLFTQFYSSSQSQLAGSMFTGFDVPVSISGNESAIGSITVTLTNSIGTSQSSPLTLGSANACPAGGS